MAGHAAQDNAYQNLPSPTYGLGAGPADAGAPGGVGTRTMVAPPPPPAAVAAQGRADNTFERAWDQYGDDGGGASSSGTGGAGGDEGAGGGFDDWGGGPGGVGW